jgi:HEAT repeat protein
LTLTQTAGESDLPALEAALRDEDTGVREAVVRGLAHLGLDAATRWLARILWDGDDTLKAAAAEELAQCGEEGVAYLHEAVESEDVMVRRAAVLGLAQAEARDVLLEVAREDTQWIVRSGAAAALDELEAREKIQFIAPPPEIEQLGWLISWAAAQGEGVGLGHAARRMLWRALSEGEVSVRLAAAQVLAQVGRPEDVEPLRSALADSDPVVARAALEALGEIGRRYDVRIEPAGE